MAVEISYLGLNCRECKNNTDIQKFRGCLEPTEHVQYVIDGKPIYICPGRMIRPDVKEYIDLYSYFKKGYLPFRGAVSEQPIKIMQIFDIIEAAERDREKNKYKGII